MMLLFRYLNGIFYGVLMAKNIGTKKVTVKVVQTKDKVKMAKGGCVKMAAGGAAKSRKSFPMTKSVPKKK